MFCYIAGVSLERAWNVETQQRDKYSEIIRYNFDQKYFLYSVFTQSCGTRMTKAMAALTVVKREKFAKNKKTTSKERLSLLLFKLCYFTSILLIY